MPVQSMKIVKGALSIIEFAKKGDVHLHARGEGPIAAGGGAKGALKVDGSDSSDRTEAMRGPRTLCWGIGCCA
jgi:hypothetical protein